MRLRLIAALWIALNALEMISRKRTWPAPVDPHTKTPQSGIQQAPDSMIRDLLKSSEAAVSRTCAFPFTPLLTPAGHA